MSALVTFDFHNTIATCDEWFALEIRDLPVRTLENLAPEVVREHGREAVVERYRALRRTVMECGDEVDAVTGVLHVASSFGHHLDEHQTHQIVESMMLDARALATPIPGAIESIQQITAAGIPVGVISSAVYHPFLEWTLSDFGIANRLHFVVTSASTGFYKSNPEIYRTAIRTAGADATRSVHVGDSEKWDVWSSKQAGMHSIWFANGKIDPLVDRAMETTPDHIVHTMTEVGPWVLAWLEQQES